MWKSLRAKIRYLALSALDRMIGGGWCWQTRWMSVHGIPPLPLWAVSWFATPLERYWAWRDRNVDNSDIRF